MAFHGTLWDRLGLSGTDNMNIFGSPDPVTEQLVVDYTQPNMVNPLQAFEASRDFSMTDPGAMVGGLRMDDPRTDPAVTIAPTPADREMKPIIDAQTMKRVLAGEISLADAVSPMPKMIKTPKVKRVSEMRGDKEDPSYWDRFKKGASDYFGDEENMANLAMGFNTMRLNPDQQLAASLSKRAQSARKAKSSKLSREAIVASLVKIGRTDLAKLVAEGSLDPKDAINAAIKKTKPSALSEKIELYEKDPEAFKALREAGVLGGATTNVNLGGNAYDKEAGSSFAKQDALVVELAAKAPGIVKKAKDVQVLLSSGAINTGWLSELKQGVDKVAASLGGKEALLSLSNTELLTALTGSDVFPMIKQLGIGARGLDTPAEREFLLAVMVGTATMTTNTLYEMAQRRIDMAEMNMSKYNSALSSGQLDDFQRVRKYNLQPVNIGGIVKWSDM